MRDFIAKIGNYYSKLDTFIKYTYFKFIFTPAHIYEHDSYTLVNATSVLRESNAYAKQVPVKKSLTL